MIEIVDIERGNVTNLGIAQANQKLLGYFIVCLGNDFTCLFVNQVKSNNSAKQVIIGNRDTLKARLLDVANMLGVDSLVTGNQNSAVFVGDIKPSLLALQALRNEFHLRAIGHKREMIKAKEVSQNLFGRQAKGLH